MSGVIDPTLILAQLAQSERLAHEIQIAPALAQAATHEVVARQVQEEQKQVPVMDQADGADALSRRTAGAAGRRRGRERRRQRRQARLPDFGETLLPGTGPPDAETGEVAGALVDTSA